MTRSQPDLTVDERNRVAQFLLSNSKNGVVNYGKAREAAEYFGVTRRTIHYIWQATQIQVLQGIPVNLTSNKKGIPKKNNLQLDVNMLKAIPFQKRGTIRKLARELGVSKSHVGRWVKEGKIKPNTNAVKPLLTENNKLQRLKFSLNALEYDRDTNKIKFGGMHNVVHIDEKWFYMSKASRKVYMANDEEEPYRACKSKSFIPKVMFMCAVARPQKGINGQQDFDGKIGIFPFTKQEPAKRNSKNRVKGTLVTKQIQSITKDVTRACIINQVIPAIKAKWPANASKNIIIQQDNARPHISNNDPEFRAAASSDGFNIIIVCQPPNSPDTNINDLSWFRAIQSLQLDTSSYNIDDLVKNVLLSYENLTALTLNNVFLTLQTCLVEIMQQKGHNNYKVPHMDKGKLIREERLPISLEVEEGLVRECIQHLMEAGQIVGVTYDIGGLMSCLGY